MRHETAIFGPKKPKFINFSYHLLLAYFLLFQQQKTPKIAETPVFYSVLANLKKENFQTKKLKTLKIEKTIFLHPFFEKGYF